MEWAWKSRLANVNAAFLNVKLKYLQRAIARRKQIAQKYNRAFKGLPVHTPEETSGRIYQEYHLQVNDREEVAAFLKKHGVETLVRDVVPNHKMEGLGLSHFDLPVTEMLASTVIRLPLHEWLLDSEVDYIIKCVKQYYA